MNSRKVIATLWRAGVAESERSRQYAYFDTAMPRAVQMVLGRSNAGDMVEFSSKEYGFQLGVLKVREGGKFDLYMSPLVTASPHLLKLMQEH